MVTWRLDRLLRSGALCALATGALPLAMAIVIAIASSSSGIFGALCVAVFVMLLAAIVGSSIVMGVGVLIFAAITIADGIGPLGLLVVGCGLYAAMVLHDLAGALRRAPAVDPVLWKGSAATVAAVIAAASGIFGLAYLAATSTTWDVALVPVALIAAGLSARYGIERHAKAK